MKGQGLRWKRVLRRTTALFFAVLAFWMLGLTCDFGAACMRLGENPALVEAVLRSELGPPTWEESAWTMLDHWQRLAVGQSALLRVRQTGTERQSTDQTRLPEAEGNSTPLDGEDEAEPPLPATTAAPEDIKERTILPADSEGYLSMQGVYLFNYTGTDMDMEALGRAQVSVALEEGPQILIVHTHGSEAYTMDGTDIYQESDSSRTIDEKYNMLRIGDEMQRIFEGLGLSVVHDRTLYDYPQYSGSYTRSCEGIQAWLEQYPSIQIVLDVHRDALIGEDGTVYKAVSEVDGETTAQVMMVVGTDVQGQEHPYWTENLALAIRIQQKLDEQWPTLARPITLRSSRFNQQLTRGSLLVEVGSHGNTLEEALRGARLFARAAGEVLLDLK